MPRITLSLLLLLAGLGLALAGCEQKGPWYDACSSLCSELAGHCELPGYEGSGACIPNCEEELDEYGSDGDDLLDCYEDAGCSTMDLIECKRLAQTDSL